MTIERLISLPPAMAQHFPGTPEGAGWFAACDPAGSKLGSGGGVAHLLAEAWHKTAADSRFEDWCESPSLKLALMAGGQSRRLPAYAATGKILMPFPALRWADGQRLDQTLLDVQMPGFGHIAARAPSRSRVMVASGDVLLRFPPRLPAMPDADIVGLGMWVDDRTASHFGVFFTPRSQPEELAFFLQKPKPEEIAGLAADHLFLVDTGLWLLSTKAVSVLFKKCGWNAKEGGFSNAVPDFYELYAGMGPCLGSRPAAHDDDIAGLTCAVVPLPDAEFYHFGTSRQMIESVSALQNRSLDQRGQSHLALKPHPDMYVLNSDFAFSSRSAANKLIWVENCTLPADLPLVSENVLTNLPAGLGQPLLAPGVCIDSPPVGESARCLRVYGFDDSFKGELGETSTLWLGESCAVWFKRRGLTFADAGLSPDKDIQTARLFPVLESSELNHRMIDWMTSREPASDTELLEIWKNSERLSAQEITERFNPARLLAERRIQIATATPRLFTQRGNNPFYRLDLDSTAKFFADSGAPSPSPGEPGASAMDFLSEAMFCAQVASRRGDTQRAGEYEKRAFSFLNNLVVDRTASKKCAPLRHAVDDQIVWGRCPIRIDLAGGWTDTPPYCLKRGGAVVNVALDLNGQPPVQVFARVPLHREIVIRSIDLGAETRIRTFEELEDFTQVGGEFSLAKAAIALAGFHPRFTAHTRAASLADLLGEFGGGLEISLLAATPKGSGLGTSSILAATLLGTLSEVCGLGWDHEEISTRTLALEQLLTTGGGWQDQAGGIHRGLKMIESSPGPTQRGLVRWLPQHLFSPSNANGMTLLYYTGITRVAKGILREIVRGMFLNRPETMSLLDDIAAHARDSFDILQRESWDGLCSVVARSWELNCALDAGTNPPAIQDILHRVSDWTAAAKLPGAGGGGYILLLAKDVESATRIRHELTTRPPNPRARFVRMDLSETGLQVTRS
ncbi:MAG: bifunctional fucokinase/fucose-1-phosphate guanylyltransferase [bacterium]